MENKLNLTLEINPSELRYRVWTILPAFLSWGTLLGLALLAIITPFIISIFVIIYDLYVLIRAGYMTSLILYAYHRLRQEQSVDWIKRCQEISGDLKTYQSQLQLEHHRQPSRELKNHLKHINALVENNQPIPNWRSIHHFILLPTYDESLEVLQTSIDSLLATDFPKDRLHIAVGFEERAGQVAQSKSNHLIQRYADKFASFITTFHPDGLPGEARVKSANANFALRQLETHAIDKFNLNLDNILVSNFDSDTVVNANYFSILTYTFISHPKRHRASYQPLPIYNNNIWDAPAFSRVIATGSTFWQMIESTRPERLVTFSSHSLTLKALKDVGYWDPGIISEDSRIFWQCLLHYNGDYETVPLSTTVSMDAALADNAWKTLVNQYKQKRRWAWGIENFPYLAEGFIKNKKITLRTKFMHLFRTLEGHHSWATAPIIIAGLGWLPILFGGPEFHSTVLSYSLPFTARTLVTIAMLGLIFSSILSVLLLPKRPEHRGQWRYSTFILQWALVPVIATTLSSFPALDAETRLALNRPLLFNVMQKSRRTRK